MHATSLLLPTHTFAHISLRCNSIFLSRWVCPFRIIRQGNTTVPEVLPLGTYTWSVNLTSQESYFDRRRRNSLPQTTGTRGIVPWMVHSCICTYCKDEIHVFNYMPPQATLQCFSALSSLIPQYNTLQSLRELAIHAVHLNSKLSLVLEEQEKVLLNSIADAGSCITHLSNNNLLSQVLMMSAFFIGINKANVVMMQGIESNARSIRQESVHQIVEQGKAQSNLPPETSVFIAPKNNSAKPLEKVEAPPDLAEREAQFARSVALALGIPAGFAWQEFFFNLFLFFLFLVFPM